MSTRNANATTWDAEYRAGRWNYLASLEQLPRYAVLAAWCHRLSCSPQVLDVGCGEALLLLALRGGGAVHYHGIDFAPAAVERAQRRILHEERETVECVAAETFDVASALPNLVVFNESLNCCPEPMDLLERYLQAVANGFVLLSITGFDGELADEVRRVHAGRLVAAVSLADQLTSKTWSLIALAGSPPAVGSPR